MNSYYNEIDPFAAEWLRNLIAAGLIAPGDVDTRSIDDVRPADLAGYDQCHFFAGIGGWSAALRLAGWSDDRPVWTGSCPCQPFSAAGKGAGFADERHLWPSWYWLIEQCRPPTLFGEQVDKAVKHGWLDLVFDDMEGLGYACEADDLPAACVGAPHIRQRAWFVADSVQPGRAERRAQSGGGQVTRVCGAGELADTDSERRSEYAQLWQKQGGNTEIARGGLAGFWESHDWLPCRDGKLRPVEPGTFPLAHGIPRSLGRGEPELRKLVDGARKNRVGRLRGYGNAIVPQVAAEFIRAYLDCRP